MHALCRHAPVQKHLDDFLIPDPPLLLAALGASTGPRFRALNAAVAGLLEQYSLVSFIGLDITEEERWAALYCTAGPGRSRWRQCRAQAAVSFTRSHACFLLQVCNRSLRMYRVVGVEAGEACVVLFPHALAVIA